MTAKLFALFTILLTSCSAREMSNVTLPLVSPTVEPQQVIKDTPDEPPSRTIEDSKRITCKGIEFDLNKVGVSPDNRWDIEIIDRNRASKVILATPSFDEYQNLGVLNAVKNEGFTINVDWGTRIYHDMRFSFTCTSSGFKLFRIDHDTFDQHFPEDKSKYQYRVRRIVPNVPLDQFSFREFMVD